MPNLTFPDGNTKSFKENINGFKIAEGISKSLLKKAVAISVNGIQKDLCDAIDNDANVEIITKDSDEGLEIMRHTVAAQVLASAIKKLYPSAKLAIGPTIKDGFYYDVFFEKPISTDDFPVIENQMKKIIETGSIIEKTYKSKKEAIQLFETKKESYKLKIIEDSDQENNFQIYKQIESDFFDLCRGPHLPKLNLVGFFKLTKLSGAYWRGNSKNEMLQRIYGTAWNTEKELKDYLNRIEEAEKRDHRRIGKQLNLFHMQEEASGSVFWHPKGWKLYLKIMNYIRKKLNDSGYKEVNTPQLVDSSLWKDSGHWDKFREQMFISESEQKTFAIKPMNCPCHVQIFRQGIKSYKDLPIRMSEFGSCHRNEPSGALHGLMRLRAFVQDDAHIFCTKEQIISETSHFCNLLMEVYKDFGFENIKIKFSDRPEVRAGSDKVWDQAEKSLIEAVEKAGYSYQINPGEGAFYGPKLEFVLTDAIGRDWQCGTLQVDFVLPERLNAQYIGEDGNKYRPVMLHRAILGSFERFIGILIEHYSGRLPPWLSPVPVALATINSNCEIYANKIASELKKNKIDVVTDLRNEKLNYKIRELSNQKINFIGIIGDKEVEEKKITLRVLGDQNQELLDFDQFIKKIKISCRIS